MTQNNILRADSTYDEIAVHKRNACAIYFPMFRHIAFYHNAMHFFYQTSKNYFQPTPITTRKRITCAKFMQRLKVKSKHHILNGRMQQ